MCRDEISDTTDIFFQYLTETTGIRILKLDQNK